MRMKRIGKDGFGLLELVIASAIGAGITMLMAGFLLNYKKAEKDAETAMMATAEESIGNRIAWLDMRRAGVSFNFLSVKADNINAAGKGFYDFLPDVSCVPVANDDCTREFVLDDTRQASRYFPMALSEGGLSKPIPISPYLIYDSVPANSLNVTSPAALNPDKFMAVMKGIGADQNLMRPGRLLRFYSPISQRPLTGSGAADMQRPPGFVSMLAQVTGTSENPTLRVVKEDWLPTQMHPTMRNSVGGAVDMANGVMGYGALDAFFRLLPPVGGSGAFAVVMPIEVVAYRLEPWTDEGRESGELVRYLYDTDGRWKSRQVVARGVKKATFLRKSISIPSMVYTLELDRKVVEE